MMQPDIRETLHLDRGECLGHPIEERLDANEAAGRVALGLRDQMLGSAEADLEADFAWRMGKQGRQSDRCKNCRATPSKGRDVAIRRACPARNFLPSVGSKKAPGVLV